jgi:small subunit ribosomal protein S12e
MAEENATQQELSTTLKKAIQQANFNGLLSKGLHETCKAIEAQKAKIVVLADNCDNKDIVALVKALAKEYQVPVLAIAEG